MPSPSEEITLGDEPTQLRRIADANEAHVRRVEEEYSGPEERIRRSHRVMSSCELGKR
jgi:hypothetical protein